MGLLVLISFFQLTTTNGHLFPGRAPWSPGHGCSVLGALQTRHPPSQAHVPGVWGWGVGEEARGPLRAGGGLMSSTKVLTTAQTGCLSPFPNVHKGTCKD